MLHSIVLSFGFIQEGEQGEQVGAAQLYADQRRQVPQHPHRRRPVLRRYMGPEGRPVRQHRQAAHREVTHLPRLQDHLGPPPIHRRQEVPQRIHQRQDVEGLHTGYH